MRSKIEMRKELKNDLDQVRRSLKETAYLSRSPKNLKRLLNALHRKEGKTLDEVRKELGI